MTDSSVPEYLNLSVPITATGLIIELDKAGVLGTVLPTLTDYWRVRKELDQIGAQRRGLSNDFVRLLQLESRWRRHKKNVEIEIRGLVDRLERKSETLVYRCERLQSKLMQLAPKFVNEFRSFGEIAFSEYPLVNRFPPSILTATVRELERVIAKSPKLNSFELCKRFDLEQIPIRERWIDNAKVTSWITAYKDPGCRQRIQKMVCVAKRRARSLLTAS